MYTYIYTYEYMCTYVYVNKHTYIYTHIHICIYRYTYIHIYIYICTYTCIFIYFFETYKRNVYNRPVHKPSCIRLFCRSLFLCIDLFSFIQVSFHIDRSLFTYIGLFSQNRSFFTHLCRGLAKLHNSWMHIYRSHVQVSFYVCFHIYRSLFTP